VICTNLMTKYLIPDIMNSNLTYMSQIFDIPHNKAHRALEDARAAANLLLTFLNFFLEKKIRKINQLYYPRNKFELDRCHYRVQDSHSEILEIIKKAPSPLVISLKGDNGLLLAIFRLNKPAIEFSFVENLMKELPWHLITIKMVGPFFEGFLELNTQYSKMQKDIQDKILRHMYLTHFSKEPTPVAEDLFASFDFLITRHLIPEQYCIYPLMNLQGQNELVFRFPGHKKKFMQYITNQTRRFENMNKGLRKSCIIKPLWNFYGNYLLQLPKWPNNFAQTTLLSKNISKKDSEKFLQDFEDFSAKDLNPFGYPKNHI